MNAYYLHSHMNHGVNVDWFEINDTVYGLNSQRGITDRYGFEIEEIPVEIATAIMSVKSKI